MSQNIRAEADQLLSQALLAKGKDNETALLLYQESLKLYLDLYKKASDGKGKESLLVIIEANMKAAEELKKKMKKPSSSSSAAALSALSASSSSASSASSASSSSSSSSSLSSSIFAFGNKQHQTATIKAPAPIVSKSSTIPSNPPDTYDYSKTNRTDKQNKSKVPERETQPRKAPTPTFKNSNGSNRDQCPKRGSEKRGSEKQSAPNEYEQQLASDILDSSPGVHWDHISGLAFAKQTLQEAVILPNLRPDLFTGLRSPPKGVLLFGPPGTGKTLLAKAVATESGFCFLSITSSSVTSKLMGDGEKLMKGVFQVARAKQPSVIFFDEIDALMSARKDSEHEASRRIKTEFMTQVDGASTPTEADRILVMGATNLPWAIDEAVLRRLSKRIYVPLPEKEARRQLIMHLLTKQQEAAQIAEANAEATPPVTAASALSAVNPFSRTPAPKEGAVKLTVAQLERIVSITNGYSGSDLSAVCHEAAMGPIRELGPAALKVVKVQDLRALGEKDFTEAVKFIRPSVSKDSLKAFTDWSEQFGVTR